MDSTQEFTKATDLLTQAKEIVIVTHERPNFDSIGSSLALSLALITLGKKVTVACPDPMTVELSNFVGVNKIISEVGKKNFVISLDYIEGSIEKVSYNIAGNTFNLVIEPRSGFPPFAEDKVHYSHAGAAADCIIAIDTIHLGGLKRLYEEEKELYATKPVINIDRHPNNVHFGQVNIIDAQASSTAEIVGQLLQNLHILLTEDIASNLLNALYGATNAFQSQFVTASAFSLAAACVSAGGKRFRKGAAPEEPLVKEPMATPVQVASTLPQDLPKQPQAGAQAAQAPADWLKPKIFKSSNLL